VLILAPAKLVPQWQFRLKDMFDVRLQRYVTEADTQRGDFWATASMVVASFHTLRDDRRGARQRLLKADPWDLVIVDEAHHLSVDEKAGGTLAYSLVSDLEERGKINSLLFFTGTPHRGKDYGFFGLMHLVHPDLFDPEGDRIMQLSQLPKVMIRNNKATVTDLQGQRIFKPVNVYSREYEYSDEEAAFYRTLSEFILDGRAYAATLDGRAQTARMLVLITLQKLAASSIAAIRNALRRRRIMLADAISRSNGAASVALPDDSQATFDDMAEAEEALPSSAAVLLMGDEIQRLDELIALSEGIANETKIERLLRMIGEEFGADEPVLLFTEYKARPPR
jgi:superfamily II DNA or RNA helicase